MEVATIFIVGHYNEIPRGALLLVSDVPVTPDGVKTEKSDQAVTSKWAKQHLEIDEPFESEALAKAADTWSGGKWWEIGGGGTVWDSMAYDPELNLLYIGTGNGSPWNRYVRSPGGGDNLYLSSIVAINPDNGKYVWHYQTTPGDTWDYTATQHMILADMEINGEQRKVIMQAPKNGFFYVIDRTSGEFISANNFVPTNWASHVDPETGRPVEIKETNHELQPALTTPGPLGGHNWHPMSYSPKTGLVYIPAQETIFGDEAYYYVRVVANKSCRWSHDLCLKNSEYCEESNSNIPKFIQERAWTSPIWLEK